MFGTQIQVLVDIILFRCFVCEILHRDCCPDRSPPLLYRSVDHSAATNAGTICIFSIVVHIRRLRTKIEPDPANPRYVVTIRGLGYKLQS